MAKYLLLPHRLGAMMFFVFMVIYRLILPRDDSYQMRYKIFHLYVIIIFNSMRSLSFEYAQAYEYFMQIFPDFQTFSNNFILDDCSLCKDALNLKLDRTQEQRNRASCEKVILSNSALPCNNILLHL